MGVQTVMLSATLYGKGETGYTNNKPYNCHFNNPANCNTRRICSFKTFGYDWKFKSVDALRFSMDFNLRRCLFCTEEGIMEFYILASVVGFVMGGIQSLSRSTYAKLMPETKDTASFFSFYDVSEKIAIVIGMFSFGFITELTGSQRTSVLALMIFFIIGLFLLLWTKAAEKKTVTN
jgi:UMF1 family MFS transporter